jgi:hypothetical protein
MTCRADDAFPKIVDVSLLGEQIADSDPHREASLEASVGNVSASAVVCRFTAIGTTVTTTS